MTMLEGFIEKGEQIGLRKGEALLAKKTETIIINLLKKFPEWSDDQIAEIVTVKNEVVREIRSKMKKRHNKNNPSA